MVSAPNTYAGEPWHGGLYLETYYPELDSTVNFLSSYTQILRLPLPFLIFLATFLSINVYSEN
jgi:hypothetical protein